jgi:KDO2-lipid IV(A) lauroyltransferase
MSVSLSKKIGRDAGWRVLSGILSTLKGDTPIETHRRRADRISRLAFSLFKSRRRVMDSNLHAVFPEWTAEQRTKTSQLAVRNITRGFLELFYYAYHPEMVSSEIELENNKVLEDLRARGQGFMVATGHVGLFPVLGVPVVAHGFPFAPVARDPHDLRLKKVFDDARTLLGYTNIPDHPPTTTLKRSLGVLRSGGAVMYSFDMRTSGPGSIDVEFLGRRTPMHSAVVRLAATTGLPIVPVHVLRTPDGLRHRVTCYPPIDVPREASKEDSPVTGEILQDLAHWLSTVIRQNPEQYWWIHRRWK